MKYLDLGGVRLPIDVVTSTVGVLGIRGSGKSNTAAVIVEEATKLGVPSVAIDPTGAWFGLKSSRDGKTAGLPFYVFGGEHADVPLEPETGAYVGRFVVEKRVPTVCDVSLMRKGRRVHFTRRFLEEVYELNREPLLVAIDEAPMFVPQMMRGDKENPDLAGCVGAVEDIGMLGRRRGLGAIIIGQRASTINKNVLEQCHTLIVHQSVGPNDRKKIDEWIGQKFGNGPERDEFLSALPELKKGEAFIWSPAFGIFKRAQIRQRTTFDSGATPGIGQRIATPKVFASVDIAKLTDELASVKREQEENDPKRLKARIAELERAKPVAALMAPKIIERSILTHDDRKLLASVDHAVRRFESVAAKHIAPIASAAEKALASIAAAQDVSTRAVRAAERTANPQPPAPPKAPPAAPRAAVRSGDAALTDYQRDLLQALARRLPAEWTSRKMMGALAGRSHKSSMFMPAIRGLETAGYILTERDQIKILSAGLDAIGAAAPTTPPTSHELLDQWCRGLGDYAGSILRVIVDAYPAPLTRAEIAERSGKSSASSMFLPALRDLKKNDLISDTGGVYLANSSELLLEA